MQRTSTVNPKITFDDSEPGNRKVICKQAIEEGELVLEEDYQLTAIYSNNITTTCHYCLIETGEVKRCSSCKYTHYCSTDHQNLDWSRGHKKECAILKNMTQEGKRKPTASLILTLKAFVQVDILKNKDLEKTLDALKSHEDKMTKENFDELRDNFIMVINYYDKNFDLERIQKYVLYQDKLLLNGVTIYSLSDPRSSLAMAVMKDFSRFNHSCEPTCFSCFNPNRGDRLVVARRIQPGEEVTISYLNTLDPVDVRKKKLREEYHFECCCPKCVREENEQKIKKTKQYTKEQLRPELETLDQIKAFLADLKNNLGEFNYEWNEALETVEPVLIKLTEYEHLYELRKQFTKKFEHWFKGIMLNPVVGQHYNNLAKLSNYLGKPEENFRYCSEALRIAKKYYVGPSVSELELMLTDVQTYLQMQQRKSIK